MQTSTAIVLVLALAVLGVVVWSLARRRRSTELRTHFGPEYDRTVQQHGSAHRAERDLSDRERRVKRLAIHPLPPTERSRYAERWKLEQARFVDQPQAAVGEADHLVEEVMKARGYPVDDFDQRVADVSVDHPSVVQNYRAAHEIALRQQRGSASTEDLRKAMIYYRGLFEELLEDRLPQGAPAR